MPTHSLPHVFRRNGLFYIRILVPQALRALVGKSELRYSLRTGYRAEACTRSGYVAARIKTLFRNLREHGMAEMTKADIRALVEQYIHESIEKFGEICAADTRDMTLDTIDLGPNYFIDPNGYPLAIFLNAWKDRTRQDHVRDLELFLAQHGFETDRHSPDFFNFYNTIVPADMRLAEYYWAMRNKEYEKAAALRTALENMDSWHPAFPKAPLTVQPSGAAMPPPPPETGHALSDALNHFKREREKTWAVRTQAEYAPILKTFLEIVGDIDCEYVTKKTLREYKEKLLKLPRALGRKSQFRDLPISQILQMNCEDEKVSHETVNKHMGLVSSFLIWAADHGYCAGNAATRMKIRLKKADPKDARAPWSRKELEVLCSPERYPMDGPAHMFWLPVLGLLTGARLDELCQLRCCDIKDDNGIWCIDINAEDGKRVKNQPSIRVFPIHPIIVQDLKFMDFVKRMETHPKAPLFPELLGFKSHSGKIASSHFSHFKDRVLKITNDKISFHSLRHTAKKWVGTLNVQKLWVNDLFGSTQEGVGDRNYGDKSQIVTLNEPLVLPLPVEIDLTFLAASPHVTGAAVPVKVKTRKKRMNWKA